MKTRRGPAGVAAQNSRTSAAEATGGADALMQVFARANLITLIAAPTVWALHFLICYVAAAAWCAKTMRDARVMTGASFPDIGVARVVIAAATALALALIALSSRQAWAHWGDGDADPPYDDPTRDGRRQFLGFATLLLCGLSFLGVIFVALPAVFIADCR